MRADQGRLAATHVCPDDVGVRLEHRPHDPGGDLGPADVDLVGAGPAGDQHPAVLDDHGIARAHGALEALAVVGRGDDQLAVLDGEPGTVGRIALQPLDREAGATVVDHDRGAELRGGVDPRDPGVREQAGQLVEHGLVDRFAAQADLLQRDLGQGVAVGHDRLAPEGRRARGRGDAVLDAGGDPALEVRRVDHDEVLPGLPSPRVTTCHQA